MTAKSNQMAHDGMPRETCAPFQNCQQVLLQADFLRARQAEKFAIAVHFANDSSIFIRWMIDDHHTECPHAIAVYQIVLL